MNHTALACNIIMPLMSKPYRCVRTLGGDQELEQQELEQQDDMSHDQTDKRN